VTQSNGSRTRSTDQRFFGVFEAIVEEVADDAREGRVKLSFPWFDPTMVTDWCRVAQLYAGNGYGSLWVPEEKDEVVVAFVHGDMRRPVVLGGLYNGSDKPPTYRAEDRDQKVLRTKAGHRIEFDDREKRVTVAAASGATITLDEGKGEITVDAGQKLTLTATTIDVTATGDLTLSGATVTVSGTPIRLN
jgi:phage baseplate assembly protein V